mmetsp:Transcript_55822/g.179181  ORF Transcript_55822/g.179181 Transcript_55822/m.179181 type:complete len:167 (+) Transcript_55822:77-577(+)
MSAVRLALATCLISEVLVQATNAANVELRSAQVVAQDPLDNVKRMILHRIRRLAIQNVEEEGTAARCKRQKKTCEEHIAQKTSVMKETEKELVQMGQEVDRCLYGKPKYTKECYALKKAKEDLDLYLQEKETLIQSCAQRPTTDKEREQSKWDTIEQLKKAHNILR